MPTAADWVFLLLFLMGFGSITMVFFRLWGFYLREFRYVEPRKGIHIKDIQTGDLLLVTADRSNSHIIATWSKSAWTHIALLIRVSEDEVLLLHAEPDDGLPDEMSSDRKEGVKLTKLSTYLEEDDCYEVVKLNGFDPTPEECLEAAKHFQGIGFRFDLGALVRSTMGNRWWIPKFGESRYDKMFCSQFICVLLQYLGAVEPEHDPEKAHPQCFRAGLDPSDPHYLPWSPGITLEQFRLIKE